MESGHVLCANCYACVCMVWWHAQDQCLDPCPYKTAHKFRARSPSSHIELRMSGAYMHTCRSETRITMTRSTSPTRSTSIKSSEHEKATIATNKTACPSRWPAMTGIQSAGRRSLDSRWDYDYVFSAFAYPLVEFCAFITVLGVYFSLIDSFMCLNMLHVLEHVHVWALWCTLRALIAVARDMVGLHALRVRQVWTWLCVQSKNKKYNLRIKSTI